MSDPYFRWHKGDRCNLSEHFNTMEFTCQCSHSDCLNQMIAISLVEKLQKVRELLGAPLTITSGFRCKTHQQELTARGCETAKSVSQHELGNAADIVSSDLKALAKLIENEFSAIGYSNRFFHVDLRSDKKRYWTYKN